MESMLGHICKKALAMSNNNALLGFSKASGGTCLLCCKLMSWAAEGPDKATIGITDLQGIQS